MYFVRAAHASGARFEAAHFIAGDYGTAGLSTRDYIGSLSEAFRVQLEFEPHRTVQYWLYVARLGRAVMLGKRTPFA